MFPDTYYKTKIKAVFLVIMLGMAEAQKVYQSVGFNSAPSSSSRVSSNSASGAVANSGVHDWDIELIKTGMNYQQKPMISTERAETAMTDQKSQKKAKHLVETVQKIMAESLSQEQEKQIAKKTGTLLAEPSFREQANHVDDQKMSMTADPNFQKRVKQTAESIKAINNGLRSQEHAQQVEEMLTESSFKEQAKRLAEQIEEVTADSSSQLSKYIAEQKGAVTTNMTLWELAKHAGVQMDAIQADLSFLEQTNLVAELIEEMRAKPIFRGPTKHIPEQVKRISGSSNFQVEDEAEHAVEQMEAMASDANSQEQAKYGKDDETSDFMDGLEDNLANREVKMASLRHTDLANNMLGKPSHLAAHVRTSLRPLVPLANQLPQLRHNARGLRGRSSPQQEPNLPPGSPRSVATQLKTIAVTAVVANGLLQLLARACGGGKLHVMAAIASEMQYLALIHASGNVFGNKRTEKFYDLTGSSTYIAITAYALASAGVWSMSVRQLLLAALVLVWTIRLGTFLFARIVKDGGVDSRFTEAKKDFSRFFIFWQIQGCWVFLTALPAFAVAVKDFGPSILTMVDYVGLSAWLIGFLFQAVADVQKTRWRSKPENKGRWIEGGLWSLCRHPNYFGEILLWSGVAAIAMQSIAHGPWGGWAAAISPFFVTFLLTRVSGIPLLQAAGKKKWGDQPAYQKYLETTPVLIPGLRAPAEAAFFLPAAALLSGVVAR